MGFFTKLKEVNEITHGKRLQQDFHKTMAYLEAFDSDSYSTVMQTFIALYLQLHKTIWKSGTTSSDGIALSKRMSDDARELLKVNDSNAYGTWLAAAWLEAVNRDSDEAHEVFCALEKIAHNIRKNNYRNGDPPDLWECPAAKGMYHPPQWNLGTAVSKEMLSDTLIIYYENIPYVSGSDTVKEYIYGAEVLPESDSLPQPFFAVRGCNDDGTQFDQYFWSDGQGMPFNEKADKILKSREGFVFSVIATVDVLLRKYS